MIFFLVACASRAPTAPSHGTITALSQVEGIVTLCEHRVPAAVCTQCDATRAQPFKDAGDWCGEHDRPESQCLICHPDLTFEPLPPLREGGDLAWISRGGESVGRLEDHLVADKVTVFDFAAAWCAPCTVIERHAIGILNQRDDIAFRKLEVTTWDTPMAKTYLSDVKSLPFLVVYGKDGARVAEITGLDLDALDAAIAKGDDR
jgi:hypothetical protein